MDNNRKAYTKGFKYDIFVSYARQDDDLPFPVPQKKDEYRNYGWVTTFVHALEHNLATKLGKKEFFNLWMDTRSPDKIRLTP